MNWLIALLAGAVLPLQAGINAQLVRAVGHPMWAAAISFLLGFITLLALLAAFRLEPPLLVGLRAMPWWCWLGGSLGAAYVIGVIFTTPKLGAASVISLAVAGQMAASLVIDHFGLVGIPVREIDLQRLVGAGLVAAGVVLIKL